MKIKDTVGILYPGQMGASVAFSIKNSGYDVYWPSEERSRQTVERAQKVGLEDIVTLASLCKRCTVIVSVCPPHLAEDVAQQVLDLKFSGTYLDANAIAPQRVKGIGRKMAAAGVNFVDGGIIGFPAWEPDSTWLYLSGKSAQAVAALFSSGPLETAVLGDEIGKASAIKMCYAANTKGTTALLGAILAAAEKLGVRQELMIQWARHGSDFGKTAVQRVTRDTAKAWRFTGEMDEISATFKSAGLPGEFHAAASEIFRRQSGFKNNPPSSFEEILKAIISASD